MKWTPTVGFYERGNGPRIGLRRPPVDFEWYDKGPMIGTQKKRAGGYGAQLC